MNKFAPLAMGLALAFVTGCGDDDETSGGDGAFSAGAFLVTVQSVDDGCFDGAIDTIVLPDGTPRPLPAPVNMPGFADLPSQIDIQFDDPFQDVTGVPIEASGSNGFRVSGNGFEQNGVDIATTGTDCVADMLVTAELIASDNDTLTGTGTLTISAATGADCPSFIAGPPCSVTTPLTAVRQ